MITSNLGLLSILVLLSVIPFIIAGGTCFIKFSIVLIMVRNALGVQQIPSNITLNSIALILTFFVMTPVCKSIGNYIEDNNINYNDPKAVSLILENGLDGYRQYLVKYSDHDLIRFFNNIQTNGTDKVDAKIEDNELVNVPLTTLMPAYALSEIQSAFKIAFYLYVPFVVIDMIISSILLALGMMMMSPVSISIPIKLILFVSINGWSLLTKGLILQYTDLMKT